MSWLTWGGRLAAFALWYAGEVVRSNLVVLKDNLTPGQDSTPGVVRYPTRCRTDGEITLLAALITLTPGTLTMGTRRTDEGLRELYVHGMYAADAASQRAELQVMEDRMLRAVRRKDVTA